MKSVYAWLIAINIGFIFLIALLSGCSSVPQTPVREMKLAWHEMHDDYRAWTAHLVKEISASNLAKQNPTDAKEICHGFERADKVEFYAQLLSVMVRRESGFKPEEEYKEDFKGQDGEYIISRGLLQISQESANSYGCGIKEPSMLHNAKINLTCGVKILSRWVERDQLVMGLKGKNLGCGRYWSVCRQTSNSYQKIREYMRGLAICKP